MSRPHPSLAFFVVSISAKGKTDVPLHYALDHKLIHLFQTEHERLAGAQECFSFLCIFVKALKAIFGKGEALFFRYIKTSACFGGMFNQPAIVDLFGGRVFVSLSSRPVSSPTGSLRRLHAGYSTTIRSEMVPFGIERIHPLLRTIFFTLLFLLLFFRNAIFFRASQQAGKLSGQLLIRSRTVSKQRRLGSPTVSRPNVKTKPQYTVVQLHMHKAVITDTHLSAACFDLVVARQIRRTQHRWGMYYRRRGARRRFEAPKPCRHRLANRCPYPCREPIKHG